MQVPAVPPAGHLEWRRALGQYLRKQSGKSLFSKPRLKSPEMPALDGSLRLRTSGGAEIDRIGDTCYAVPAADQLPELSGDPVHARFMQAMQPLFAHEVSCPGAAGDDLGKSFLKALRAPAGSPP